LTAGGGGREAPGIEGQKAAVDQWREVVAKQDLGIPPGRMF
jgi:hypothetical protein